MNLDESESSNERSGVAERLTRALPSDNLRHARARPENRWDRGLVEGATYDETRVVPRRGRSAFAFGTRDLMDGTVPF